MARSSVILREDARRFRAAIRPSLYGQIGALEPVISQRAAAALNDWLFDVVQDTLRVTSLRDNKGEIARQLRSGIRVTGRNHLNALRGQIWAQPWLFAHEYGAHIVPRSAQYLTIPIFYGLRPDGTPKYKTARSWNRYGSFVYTNKRTGKKYLAYRPKGGGQLRILYVLVDSTDIPARLGLNRMSNQKLGQLLSTWGAIYVQEAARSGVINLWGATR